MEELSETVRLLQTSPVATACLLLGIALLIVSVTKHRESANIPGIRYGSIPGLRAWQGAIAYMRDPNACLKEGLQKYPHGDFKVATFTQEYVVVNDAAKLSEYLAASDEVFSAYEATNINLQTLWTMGPGLHYRPYHIPVIRGRLTQNIATLMPGMQNEVQSVLDSGIGEPEAWRQVTIYDLMVLMVAQLSHLAFAGQPLGKARNQAYRDIAIKFTFDLILSAELLKVLPDWAKKILVGLTPCYRSKQKVIKLIGGFIDERLKASDCEKSTQEDLLQWLIDTAPPIERTVPQLAERLLTMSFASIHTTTMTLTFAIYMLCSEPDKYLPQLRAEVQQHCSGGQFTRSSLDSLLKVDSFLRECGRHGPLGNITSYRYVKKDFEFKDGTVVPAGSIIVGSQLALHKLWGGDELAEFDGFRYSRPVEAGAKQPQLVSTGADYLLFGHGKHACPGRYFAASEMKLVFANLILRYDMKLIPGTTPLDMYIGPARIPETKLKILVKAAGSEAC